MKKKIAILTTTKMGTGHYSAAKGIYECFHSNYKDVDVRLFDIMDFLPKPGIFNLGYNEVIKVADGALWQFSYDISNKFEIFRSRRLHKMFMNILFLKQLKKDLSDFQPDVVIYTHFDFDLMLKRFFKTVLPHAKLAHVVTDYGHVHSVHRVKIADWVFTPDEISAQDLRQYINAKIIQTGFPTEPRFYLEERPKIKDLTNILIIAPTNWTSERKYEYLTTLIPKIPQQIMVTLVCGRDEALYQSIQTSELSSRKNFTLIGHTDQIHQLMQKADLCLSKSGGAVMSELIQSLCPMIVFTYIPGQEKENLNFILRENIGWHAKSIDEVLALLDELSKNPSLVSEKVENIKNIRKINPAKAICDYCLGLV